MGVAATWCAFREEHADQVLELLGLTPTGATEEFPESLISAARLNSGWRVLWYGKYVCPFLRTEDLQRLSQDYDVILCRVEEHVMANSSEMWSTGKRKWWLSHEGEDGPKGLSAEGDLPHAYQTIKNEMEQRQVAEGGDTAEADYILRCHSRSPSPLWDSSMTKIVRVTSAVDFPSWHAERQKLASSPAYSEEKTSGEPAHPDEPSQCSGR